MAVTALKSSRNAVESLRDIVQDLLVPELKAIKAELDSQRRENQFQFEAIRTELNIKTDGISAQLRIRHEQHSESLQALRTETNLRFEQLNDRLGTLLEVRERLAVLEDRAKHS